jgi:hypothetical protein
MQGRNIQGNIILSMKDLYVRVMQICILFLLNSLTATSTEGWYWTGGNAINNAAYGEDVGVPDFI